MAIKPILFYTEMVQAILDGRKTCTRRIVKGFIPDDAIWGYIHIVQRHVSCWIWREVFKPPYQQGDILYVRETWGHPISLNSDKQYVFRADKIAEIGFKNDSHIWHPSIHMPKEAARIWLRVTDVRVERLQDMTDDDAEAEGCFDYTSTALGFPDVWDSTIKKSDIDRYGWDANPWVWVIEFERCDKPKEV